MGTSSIITRAIDKTNARSLLCSMSNDRSYLALLQDYYARHRALPSYASIGQLLGLKSKSSVAAMVARLKLLGYLESTPDRRLAPTGRFFARALAESPVQAGEPNPVEDGHSDALTIDHYLIERPSRRSRSSWPASPDFCSPRASASPAAAGKTSNNG